MNFRKANTHSHQDKHMLSFRKNAFCHEFSWEMPVSDLPVFLCSAARMDFLLLLFSAPDPVCV